MGARCNYASSHFQKTGIKPSKTRSFASRRGFSGLRYARLTEIHSNTKLSEEFPPTVPLKRRQERREERVDSVEGTLNMADSREVMNIRQASQYLGVSPDTLYKYVGEQKIPAFKLGNRWRFKKSKLDEWMEEKSNQMETKGKKKPKAAVKAAGSL
jgi:excisionase family DNA binding protein